MTRINELSQKESVSGGDIFPIWDSEAGGTRAVLASSIKSFIGDEFTGKHVESGVLSNGTLTLTFNDGTTTDISGFVVNSTDLTDMPDNLEAGKILKVNSTGDGYILVSEPSIGGEINVFNDNVFVSSVDGINVRGDLFSAPSNGVTTASFVGEPNPVGDIDEIYTYDTATNRLKKTGVKAKDGTIITSANSVKIGAHTISSSGQNLQFRNDASQKVYAPSLAEIDENGNADPVRIVYTSESQTIVISTDQSEDIPSPEWNFPTSLSNRVFYSITISNVVNTVNNVYLYGYSSSLEVFREFIPTLNSGTYEIVFKSPLFIKSNENIQLILINPDDSLGVVVKGSVEGIPAYSIKKRDYIEKKLVTNDDIDIPLSKLNDVEISNPENGQVLTYENGFFNLISPYEYEIHFSSITTQGNVGTIQNNASNYIYVNLQILYQIDLPTIDIEDLSNVFFYVRNFGDNDFSLIEIVPPDGVTINNSTNSKEIEKLTEIVFVYDSQSSNWIIVFENLLSTALSISDSNGFVSKTDKITFQDSKATLQQDGSVTVVPNGIKFYQNETDADPFITTNSAVFPNSSLFIDGDKVIVDTAFGVTDDKNNSAGDVISLKFQDATVIEEEIPNRDGRNALIIPDLNSNTVEPRHAGSLLAYVGNRKQINSIYQVVPPLEQTNIYFDDVQLYNTNVITFDKDNQQYTLKKRDGDTSTTYFISATISFENNVVSDYGYVRLFINEDSAQAGVSILETTDGYLFATQNYYNNIQKMGSVSVEGFVTITQDIVISFHIEDSLTENILYLEDRDVLPSAVVIQEVTEKYQTSPALLQYCIDFQKDIRIAELDLANVSSIDWLTKITTPVRTIPAGTNNNLYSGEIFQSVTDLNFSIQNGKLNFTPDGGNDVDFAFGSVVNNEYTRGLRGKQVIVSTTTETTSITQILAISWVGEADKFNQEVIAGRNPLTQDVILTGGWELFDIIRDNNAGSASPKTYTKIMTIPLDAVNVAFLFFPDRGDEQISISISSLNVITDPAIKAYVYSDPSFHGNNVKYDDNVERAVYGLNNRNFGGDTVYFGTSITDVPIGNLENGKAPIIIYRDDPTSIYGSLQFPEDCRVIVNSSLTLFNGTATTNTANFQWYVRRLTGDVEAIPDTLNTFPNIAPDTSIGTTVNLNQFVFNGLKGERIYMRGYANVANGVYITTDSGQGPQPVVRADIQYREIIPPKESEIPRGDILRVIYNTNDSVEANQPILAANTPQVVKFTFVEQLSEYVEVNLSTGVFTFLSTEPAHISVNFQVRRVGTSGGDIDWGFFVDISLDNGVTWNSWPRSAVRETFSSTTNNQIHILSATIPVKPEQVGMQFRLMQFATSIASTLEIISIPASGSIPTMSGALIGVYSTSKPLA